MKTTTYDSNPLRRTIASYYSIRSNKKSRKKTKSKVSLNERALDKIAVFMVNAVCILAEFLAFLILTLYLSRLNISRPVFFICCAIIGLVIITVFGFVVEFIECRIRKHK